MFKHWPKKLKVSCLVITHGALPKNDNEHFPSEKTVGWSALVIRKYAAALEIDPSAYEHIVRTSYTLPAETLPMIEPFINELKDAGESLRYVMELYVFMVTNGLYDARGRVTIRNCAQLLELSKEDYFALETALAQSLRACEENLARKLASTSEKDNAKLKRYVKIGAAGLGAGAVIAFTGGMAAPAVAAALLVMGGSAAAAAAGFATFTVLASVFGTAGAGLAGYKMARRTKGIDEFKFEQFGDRGMLAVCIMVSGWMNEDEDYKRTFGILPSAMTLEEALTRFYRRHDKTKIAGAKAEAQKHEEDPSALVNQVTEQYGRSPVVPANMSTPYITHSLSHANLDMLNKMVNAYVMPSGRGRVSDEGKIDDIPSTIVKSSATQEATILETKGSLSKTAGKLFWGAAKYTADAATATARYTTNAATATSAYTSSLLHLPYPIAPQGERVSTAPTDEAVCNIVSKQPQSPVGIMSSGDPEAEVRIVRSQSTVESLAPLVTNESIKMPPTEQQAVSTTEDTIEETGGAGEVVAKSQDGITAEDAAESATPVARFDQRYWNWTELEFANMYELYLLKWETETQMEFGTVLMQLLGNLRNTITEKLMMYTAAGIMMSAISLPYGLIKLTGLIDRTWVIATERADAAGIELAGALLNRPQGSRPVTLVGHSIGARVIFSCLKELARHREESEANDSTIREDEGQPLSRINENPAADHTSEGFFASETVSETEDEDAKKDAQSSSEDQKFSTYGIIQDVVLLGLPTNTSQKHFKRARSVVAGRFINGFSNKDVILAFLYRFHAREAIRVAGLQAVNVEGVENLDLSETIGAHTDYSAKMKYILRDINLGYSSMHE